MSTVPVHRLGTTALALCLAAPLAIGCGAPSRQDPDETFRRIQVHEATVAHRWARARDCEAGAPCPAAEEVCEAADALCELAEALEDADALTRCELARRRCREARP